MITLGIDSGTQSTKTIALDLATGEILASAQAAYGMVEGLPPGHLEQHPQAWTDAVDKTVRACLSQLGARKSEVAAIGVSGQQHGCVVLSTQLSIVIKVVNHRIAPASARQLDRATHTGEDGESVCCHRHT